VASGDPGEFPWQTTWKRTTFAGWKKIGLSITNLDEEVETSQDAAQSTWIQAISIKEGDKVKWKSLETAPQVSNPKPRYTEATLVRELEKKGIGRPSTYASLVGTLLDKNYTEKRDKPASDRKFSQYLLSKEGQWPPTEESLTKKVGAEKDKMVPTALGLSLLEFCIREFGPLFDYGFTAQMETRLDKVSEGTESWKQVCRDTWDSYKDTYFQLKGTKGTVSTKVKEFADGLKAVQGKKGPILLKEDPSGDKEKTVFYGWPEGVAFGELTEEAAIAFAAKPKATQGQGILLGTMQGKSVLVVGAGDMGAGIARALSSAGAASVTVMNRNAQRAEQLAATVGAVVSPISELAKALGMADVVLTCTGATEPIITAELVNTVRLTSPQTPLLIVDIAMPRDVEHSVSEIAHVTLRDLYDLRDWAQVGINARNNEADAVRSIIGEEVERFTQESIARQAAPLVAELHERAENIRRAEMERFATRMSGLTPEQRELVETMSKSVVAKLLHTPSIQLKNSAGTPQGERIAAALRDLFDIE
jgi:NAD(P)-dependent dehydrogenase (short-subunit alcohol dehydrogenase family)